jgi:Spy/CpxP family protein refolding chaperone
MERFVTFAAITVICAVMVFPVPVIAAGDEGVPPEGDVGRVRKKVEALRAWRLTEELDLDEETSARLFPAIREADEQRLALEKDNRKLVRALNQELQKEAPDDGKVNSIIDKMVENRREQAKSEERHIRKVRQILSPEMTGKYLMFQFRFQKELRKMVSERARDRREKSGPGGGKGPGGGSGGGSGGKQ